MNKKSVLKAIKDYNRIRSPEATASLDKIKKNSVLVRFSGPFCKTCGVQDYFDDFSIEARNENLKLAIKNIQHRNESYIVEFEG